MGSKTQDHNGRTAIKTSYGRKGIFNHLIKGTNAATSADDPRRRAPFWRP